MGGYARSSHPHAPLTGLHFEPMGTGSWLFGERGFGDSAVWDHNTPPTPRGGEGGPQTEGAGALPSGLGVTGGKGAPGVCQHPRASWAGSPQPPFDPQLGPPGAPPHLEGQRALQTKEKREEPASSGGGKGRHGPVAKSLDLDVPTLLLSPWNSVFPCKCPSPICCLHIEGF